MSLENFYHVIPVNDSKTHSETLDCEGICDCECKPRDEEILKPSLSGEPHLSHVLVIHSSFDGREGVEWINEILNPQLCYKTGEPCPFKCEGLCKDSY